MSSLFNAFGVASAQSEQEITIVPVQRGLYNPKLPDGSTLLNIVAMATIMERHHDEMEITDHPVATGSNIVDHAFKRPSEVTLHLGWSDSPNGNLAQTPVTDVTGSSSTIMSDNNGLLGGMSGAIPYVNGIYDQLRTMQSSRALFDLYTAKYIYHNMLIRSLVTETDYKSENSLPIIVECKEIILVDVATVTINPQTAANQQANGSPVNTGQKDPTPIANDVSLAQGVVNKALNGLSH